MGQLIFIVNSATGSGGGGVTTFEGRAGAVVGVAGDYTSTEITNLSSVVGATVSDALDQLDSDISTLTSSDIANASTVVGATVTDALNALNSITPAATVDIYMATTGNDANPGTIASPVLTLVGAYSKIPINATLPVIHVATGTYAWAPIPIPLTIIGDGAGQGADTGFTTVTTGVSAAGTTSTQYVLAAPVAVNLYRGMTIEWTSGAVGVLGGETVASAALAAALSGVRDLYASVIARAS